MKEHKNKTNKAEQSQGKTPSPLPLKLLGEQNLELVKRFEKLIADWYHLTVQTKEKALHQIRESLGEPVGATSGGSFPSGQNSHEIQLDDLDRIAPPAPSPQPQEDRPWRWSLVWLGILGAFGGLGTAALVWLTSLPPLPNCQQFSQLTADGERLYCAQQAAQTGELPKIVASLEMLKQWDSEHPLHGEATRLIDEWSARILVNARIKMRQNDAKGAIEAIKHIPKTSAVYADGQEIVKEWRDQWQKGKEVFGKAQTAMKEQKWDDVSSHILALSKFDHEYWSTVQANALAQQLGVERQARQVLLKAQKLSKAGSYTGIREAITLAQKVSPKTYAGVDAKANLSQWSQTLLTAGLRQWNTGDRGGAISTLFVPPADNTVPEVQDLVRFGNAYMMVNSTESQWVPTGNQIWNLMEAIAAIKQVKSTSPFYAQAQAHLKDWQSSLKDIVQVKYATMAADLGQHDVLKMAISQAKQVPTGHARRIQAQTLIAYWAQEVERIEDEPFLVQAKNLAQSGKIPDLKAAIAQARNVQLGRTLRGQAQDWISTWRSQIEVIEDQPILAQAQAFGRQGKLTEAIDAASRIKEGRALYTEAQSAVWNWRAEQIRIAQIAQDQPILNRAMGMAYNGNLSGAIDVAAQISPGRALYYEAQSSIAIWEEELRPPVYVPPAPPTDETPAADSQDNWVDNGTNSVDPLTDPLYEPAPEGSAASDPASVPSSLELAPADEPFPVEEAPAPEEPPIIEAMPMDEILPSSSIEAPPPIVETPQAAAPRASSLTGYYDERYYNNKP
jgi:hypothetical protein